MASWFTGPFRACRPGAVEHRNLPPDKSARRGAQGAAAGSLAYDYPELSAGPAIHAAQALLDSQKTQGGSAAAGARDEGLSDDAMGVAGTRDWRR